VTLGFGNDFDKQAARRIAERRFRFQRMPELRSKALSASFCRSAVLQKPSEQASDVAIDSVRSGALDGQTLYERLGANRPSGRPLGLETLQMLSRGLSVRLRLPCEPVDVGTQEHES